MTPPPSDHDYDAILSRQTVSAEDLQRIKWAGWALAGTCLMCWSGWISLLAISNSTTVRTVEERQIQQFERLRDDIGEIKQLLRSNK